MTLSATKIEADAWGCTPLRRDRPSYHDIVKKVVFMAVLVMIAALPVTACVSATDDTRSKGAAVVRPVRYPLAVYSLTHLPNTIEGHFDTRIKHPRLHFSQSAHSITKGLLTGSFFVCI